MLYAKAFEKVVKNRLSKKRYYTEIVQNIFMKNEYENPKPISILRQSFNSYILTQLGNKPSNSVMVGSGRVGAGQFFTDMRSTHENNVFFLYVGAFG